MGMTDYADFNILITAIFSVKLGHQVFICRIDRSKKFLRHRITPVDIIDCRVEIFSYIGILLGTFVCIIKNPVRCFEIIIKLLHLAVKLTELSKKVCSLSRRLRICINMNVAAILVAVELNVSVLCVHSSDKLSVKINHELRFPILIMNIG